jgi:CRISPR-associated Csx2 family protein
MRKVFVSFLGTNDYIPCNYIWESFRPLKNVRFVQEATISWHCKGWEETDEILIFTTEEAHQKNWLDDGHKDQDGNVISREGLETRLALLSLPVRIREVTIPTGKNEQEIWDIFSTIVNKLEDGDELHLDITHAFRSLPLLATVIINYAKVVKNIQVKAISYGAMEAVGNVRQVKQIDIEQLDIPVFNLLPFDQLLDWSSAIDRFIVAGDATGIQSLTSANVILRKKEVRGPDKEADSLKKMADALMSFSKTLAACRGKNIVQDAAELKDTIHNVKEQNLVKPLTPLLEKLEKTVAEFSNDEVRDGVAAAGWCLKHNLVQQGFTLLQETMCTYILKQSTKEDSNDKNKRNLVGMAIAIERDGKAFDDWSPDAQHNKKIIQEIRDWLRTHQKLFDSMNNLSQDRNDLNHAGMNDSPMSASKFGEKLKQYIYVFSEEIT